jgi:hypothetical protein
MGWAGVGRVIPNSFSFFSALIGSSFYSFYIKPGEKGAAGPP